MDQNISPPDQASSRNSRLSELIVFLTIIVFIWPVVAVGVVGATDLLSGFFRCSSARPARLRFTRTLT